MRAFFFFALMISVRECTSNYLRGFNNRNQNDNESKINILNYNYQCENEIVYKSIYEVWLDCLITYKTRERERANLIH